MKPLLELPAYSNDSVSGARHLRHKSSREAADDGLLLWRENFFYFLPFFAIPFWICAFGLHILLDNILLSYLILWLLKPFFDRLILHIISVKFFDRGAGIKRLCKGLGKSLRRGLIGDLLWRRFSLIRSAMMPVRVLEPTAGKSGKNRKISNRKKILKQGGIGYCFLLTVWGKALEITLLAGEMIFVSIMIELIGSGFLSALYENSAHTLEVYIFAAWCFNYMLIETLYVCMGFGLYINSRIEVEGWDVEIMFRGFAEKLKNKSKTAALIVFCFAFLLMPVKTFATPLGENASKDFPIEVLQNVLSSPEFGGERDSWGIQLKKQPEQSEPININLTPKTGNLRWILANSLRIIIIALFTGIVVFLFFLIKKTVYEKKSDAVNNTIKTMHDIPKKNPQFLLKKAEYFFEYGNLRLAWGYCTAAAILSWPFYRGLPFPLNATESDCANMVNSFPHCNTDEALAFNKLINTWVNYIYAGRIPPAESFNEAVAFCKSFPVGSGGRTN